MQSQGIHSEAAQVQAEAEVEARHEVAFDLGSESERFEDMAVHRLDGGVFGTVALPDVLGGTAHSMAEEKIAEDGHTGAGLAIGEAMEVVVGIQYNLGTVAAAAVVAVASGTLILSLEQVKNWYAWEDILQAEAYEVSLDIEVGLAQADLGDHVGNVEGE